MNNLKIAFVIVTFQTSKKEIWRLKGELESLSFPPNKTIYFIDNTRNNKGYAAGVNKGIKQALAKKADIIFICNPDISLSGLNSSDLLAVFDHFDIAGYAFKQRGATYYGGVLDKKLLSGGLNNLKPAKRFYRCDFVSGSLMGIKREVIEKIGLCDESYFLYYEDVDYCLRAKKSGFRVGIDSRVCYSHEETSADNPQKALYLARNHQRILAKYGTLYQKIYGFAGKLSQFVKSLLYEDRS
ncbi:hypothetical protein A3F03_00020 [Candidatus Roizmanbacteria bacterium RIFCSPHIGHO2_12_FULL_41_11]|uniref:Glycosyltransferase 2-like domain-containing protein n=2 Tax=Candidatus Roizmaniibacteriota TaxID=1752723 RepID=A0A1F7JRK3_9BACT|nr:MAG: hypothetical protein A3F03_00020 [Candidatus Roizmanbacteria bacterium RIFCSPHIGHO2_12_FULL_41_11]OGK58250.1 MAG: hypothetical protein A3H86_03755 [Candidatus Roizmanbacteria bacterium RIFCSPLOWO2_02_FULL_41_9]